MKFLSKSESIHGYHFHHLHLMNLHFRFQHYSREYIKSDVQGHIQKKNNLKGSEIKMRVNRQNLTLNPHEKTSLWHRHFQNLKSLSHFLLPCHLYIPLIFCLYSGPWDQVPYYLILDLPAVGLESTKRT